MPRLRKQYSGLLVTTALCAALIFAVSVRFPDPTSRAVAILGVLAIAALLVGVIWTISNARAARQRTVLKDAHELSTLAFPPSRSGALCRGK
jgi:glucose uptake protein GlcU